MINQELFYVYDTYTFVKIWNNMAFDHNKWLICGVDEQILNLELSYYVNI